MSTALRGADLDHDGAIELAEILWNSVGGSDVGGRAAGGDTVGGDSAFFERLLRQARTWALVDPLAGDAVGPLAEHDAKFAPVLERWAVDEDFWIRRSALLAHLRPLREGRGAFERFARFADGMLEEKEFFIRRAIGWVLRDTARKRPEMVFDWMLPRAHRASGVTMREMVKHLSPEQREELLAAR